MSGGQTTPFLLLSQGFRFLLQLWLKGRNIFFPARPVSGSKVAVYDLRQEGSLGMSLRIRKSGNALPVLPASD